MSSDFLCKKARENSLALMYYSLLFSLAKGY